MKTSHRALLTVLFFTAPGVALGHGFDLELNSTYTGVTVLSEESQLDNGGSVGGGTDAGLNTLFLEDFSGTPATSLTGSTYYSVIHGYADLAAGSYGVPPSDYFTATFNIISPLYFSDGSAGSTASGAVLASSGTYIQMYDAYYASFSGPSLPGASPGYVTVSGSTPFAAGFQTSMAQPHELTKELYLAPGSTQTYGEYGFAFDVTLTLGNGTTIVTPPLVDIFAVTDPSLGNFGNDAPDTVPAGEPQDVPQQDAATLSIFYAATAAGNSVLGNTASWNGSANSTWSNTSNWENGVVPGSTTGTTSNDTVVFYTNAANSVPTIDAGRNVQTILFEQGPTEYGTTGVGTLTLGTTTGNALLLTNGGSIQLTSTVANPQVVNAPLVLEGANALYTFNTDSLTASATLSFGGSITGGAAGSTVLTLGGDNMGNNTISGAISNGAATSLAILESGGPCNWILSGQNSYTGGTTVNEGTLTVTASGTLGSSTSPLTITTVANLLSATVNINGNQSVGTLSGTILGGGTTGTLNIAAGSSLTVNQAISADFGATLNIAAGTASSFGTFALQGPNTLEIDAPPTLGDYSAINVNGGTLRFNVSSGPATVGSGVTVTVASAATLQLAGSVSALSGGGTANIVNNGATVDHGGLSVTGTNQTVGTITGAASSTGGVTTYGGDTVVGNGTVAASLTATQILQNTLTINAGSTVTIQPSGSGISEAVSSDIAASSGVLTATDDNVVTDLAIDSGADPFIAIQAAIASGAISSQTGQRLENRIAAILRLQANDPSLDAGVLEDSVLAAIPSSDWTAAPLPGEADSGVVAADLDAGTLSDSTAGSLDGSSEWFASSGNGATAVPEPAAFLLAAIGGLVIAFAARTRGVRPRVCRPVL